MNRVDRGANDNELIASMGHNDIKTTRDIYMRLTATSDETRAIIGAVYCSGFLSFGKRRKYLERHIKKNGKPKAITKTNDGGFKSLFPQKKTLQPGCGVFLMSGCMRKSTE